MSNEVELSQLAYGSFLTVISVISGSIHLQYRNYFISTEYVSSIIRPVILSIIIADFSPRNLTASFYDLHQAEHTHPSFSQIYPNNMDTSDTSALRPPNIDQLSDNVICSVVTHAKHRRSILVTDTSFEQCDLEENFSLAAVTRNESIVESAICSPTIRGMLSASCNKCPETGAKCEAMTLPKRKPTDSGNMCAELKQLLLLGEKIQRQRWRDDKRRYRKNKGDHAKCLENTIKRLRQVVEQLGQRRRVLCSNHSAWSVAVEYFRLFRYGLQSNPSNSDTTKTKPLSDHLIHLRSAMTPDVIFNSGRGEGYIVQSWWCLSQWFADIVVDLDELQNAGGGAVLATITISFTITERTFRGVFPHVRDGEKSIYGPRLLNQGITLRGWTRFEWDSGYHRVTSITAEADFLSPMLALVGSLDKVSRLFEKSLVSPAFHRHNGIK
ncbi:hypothetical protein ON010_g4929 [Phytophthora cinnamomi]|nr:hypothetical protein ON010_g4929 [Phytophthora cinnamomi]